MTNANATQIRSDLAAWSAAKYNQAITNGATDAQALAAVKALMLKGIAA